MDEGVAVVTLWPHNVLSIAETARRIDVCTTGNYTPLDRWIFFFSYACLKTTIADQAQHFKALEI
ncbi:hypothetical protein DPH57_25195 [Massilia sp. YMA4]|nr:hypothetical protein DPH57_25195 [Massilia sp. YMA4]